MDSITQALLGGAIQGAMLGKKQGRRALLYGAVLATVPDLDALVQYGDPISNMTYHRGFSHSLFVLTALAALLAWLIRKRWPDGPYSSRQLFVTLWLVLVTHPLLDSFTIYGTQLFWPLPLTPESWSAIFIIDPAYTLPLLIAVAWASLKGFSTRINHVLVGALFLTSIYLLSGLSGRMLAEQRVQAALRTQGIVVTQLRAVPMPYNILVWRVLAKSPDGHYYEAISSAFDRAPPEWIRHPRGLDLGHALETMALHQRLQWFTDDWLRYELVNGMLIVSDLRMGIPGLYSFRFVMAHCDSSGSLVPVTPSAWPSRMAGGAEARLIFQRILHQQPPLPLREWAVRNLGNTDELPKACPGRGTQARSVQDTHDRADALIH